MGKHISIQAPTNVLLFEPASLLIVEHYAGFVLQLVVPSLGDLQAEERMPEGLHILCKGVGSHHADFQLKLVITLGALVGYQSEPHVEPTGIGPVLGDELSCC